MANWRATVTLIVKTIYLLHRKSCAAVAQFWLDFSIFLLCQVKNPDVKNILNFDNNASLEMDSNFSGWFLNLLVLNFTLAKIFYYVCY